MLQQPRSLHIHERHCRIDSTPQCSRSRARRARRARCKRTAAFPVAMRSIPATSARPAPSMSTRRMMSAYDSGSDFISASEHAQTSSSTTGDTCSSRQRFVTLQRTDGRTLEHVSRVERRKTPTTHPFEVVAKAKQRLHDDLTGITSSRFQGSHTPIRTCRGCTDTSSHSTTHLPPLDDSTPVGDVAQDRAFARDRCVIAGACQPRCPWAAARNRWRAKA